MTRPRLHVRGRLFLASLGVVSAVIVVAGVFAHVELRAWIEQRIEAELEHKLAAARVTVEAVPGPPDDALADALGRALDARLTFIDEAGVVRGDSEVDGAGLAALENHRGRPEVEGALTHARGRDRRTSSTVHKDMLYLAERYARPDGIGVVRVAADYDDVDAAVARLRLLLAMAGALGLAAAVGMSALASQLLSRTLRALVVHARSLVGGGFGDDDIGGIAGTLQKLADDLGRTVGSLASERDRTAAVLEAMSEGVIGLDAAGKVVLVNAAAKGLLPMSTVDGGDNGGSAGDALGRALVEVTRVPALDDVGRRARAGEVASVEIELRAPVPRTLLVRAAPVRAGGAVIVLHDVSEVRRLERVRRDFVGNVSHELRTPVSVIRASAETLLHTAGIQSGDEARGFLEAIERNAERLTRLVGDLLDLSRIEAGEVPFLKQSLVLAELCRRAVDNLDVRQRREHAIAVEVPEGLVALADAKAVDQVLVNLLDNAVKYTPKGGHITLRAKPVDGGALLRIEIEDDGPGIEPQHRGRLFERFYRVDAGRSRDVGGTGLGLAIVKHLVEGMGGRAGVEPAAMRGSIFFFSLPSGHP